MKVRFSVALLAILALLGMGMQSPLSAQSPDPYIHHGGVLIHMSVMSKANLEPTGWTEDEVKAGSEQCRRVCGALQYPDAARSLAMARPWLDSLFFNPATKDWQEGKGYGQTFEKLRERVKQINGPITIMRVKAETSSEGLRCARFYIKGPDMKCPPADVTPAITPEGGKPWSMVVAILPNGKMKVTSVFGDLNL